MADVPNISEAEWRVMDVLWTRSPLTAGEVVDALRGSGWGARTIKTMLGRLVNKRAVRAAAQGNRFLYRPAVTRAECVRSESRSFVSRVFGGAAGPMLVHFVSETKLTAAEIRELKKVLARKGK